MTSRSSILFSDTTRLVAKAFIAVGNYIFQNIHNDSFELKINMRSGTFDIPIYLCIYLNDSDTVNILVNDGSFDILVFPKLKNSEKFCQSRIEELLKQLFPKSPRLIREFNKITLTNLNDNDNNNKPIRFTDRKMNIQNLQSNIVDMFAAVNRELHTTVNKQNMIILGKSFSKLSQKAESSSNADLAYVKALKELFTDMFEPVSDREYNILAFEHNRQLKFIIVYPSGDEGFTQGMQRLMKSMSLPFESITLIFDGISDIVEDVKHFGESKNFLFEFSFGNDNAVIGTLPEYVFMNYTKVLHSRNKTPYVTDPSVREAYVSTHGSKELNVSLNYFFTEGEQIDESLLFRASSIMEEHMEIYQSCNMYENSLIVYHGTTQLIHVDKLFVCNSFMSTTRDIETAIEYAGEHGVIYVIRIPKKFPFINLSDDLQQILLPMSTHIKIVKTVDYTNKPYNSNKTYVVCNVLPFQPDYGKMIIDLFRNPCFRDMKVHFKENPHKYIIDDSMINCPLKSHGMHIGSSVFYKTEVNGKPYIFKDIVKASDTVGSNRTHNQVFKRILNEVLSSVVYSKVYGLDTFKYYIYQVTNECVGPYMTVSPFLLASKEYSIDYKTTLNDRKLLLMTFFVDCVMGNWDVNNNDNWGMYVRKGDQNKKRRLIHTDVGGCLMFRGKGDEKLRFTMKSIPNDHLAISAQESFKNLISGIPIETCKDLIRKGCKQFFQDKTLKPRLQSVKEEFLSLIDLIDNSKIKSKYKTLISSILESIEYRHEYYKTNRETVIEQVFSDENEQEEHTINKRVRSSKNISRGGKSSESNSKSIHASSASRASSTSRASSVSKHSRGASVLNKTKGKKTFGLKHMKTKRYIYTDPHPEFQNVFTSTAAAFKERLKEMQECYPVT